MELLNLGQLPGEVGVRSEQATVHSAPSPWPFLFEMNETDNLVAAKLTLSGPFFWQNLGKRWNKSMFWCWGGNHIKRHTTEEECTSENGFKPFLSKSEKISPFALAVWLWVGDVKLWARHHQRRTGAALLWTNIRNEWYSELKKQYLEVDYTFGVASIRLPMLGLVAKTLVWPNVNNLKIDTSESRYM